METSRPDAHFLFPPASCRKIEARRGVTVRFLTTNNTRLPVPIYIGGPKSPPRTVGLRTSSFRKWLGVVSLLTLSILLVGGADAAADKAKAGPKPALTLPVDTLGYHSQSASLLVDRLSRNTLDFIDQSHLLLTFRNAGLLKRIDDARPGDEDQSIHAVVLELPSGKVVRSADWRMHDHGHYLWAMQDGRFLIRQRDKLFLTDADLELRPYLEAPARLQGVQPSPDGKMLVIQLDKEKHSVSEHERLTQQALAADAPLPREDVSIAVVNAATAAVLVRIEAARPINLPLIGDGYLETLPAKQDHWQLTYVRFSGEKKVFGDVLSTCTPAETPATATVLLLTTCHARTDDHLVQAINLDGKLLWESWWDNTQIWPSLTHSRDGSRFAVSRLRASHGVNALDPVGEDDIKGQRLQVLDPVGGSVLLDINVTPAASTSENFALSPDGKKFAVLTAAAVDVYDVPAPALSTADPKKKK